MRIETPYTEEELVVFKVILEYLANKGILKVKKKYAKTELIACVIIWDTIL